MTRKTANRNKNRKTAAAAVTAAATVAAEEVRSKEGAVYGGDKKLYVSVITEHKPVSWLKIDPHYSGDGDSDNSAADEIDGCFALTRMPGSMNTPPPDRDAYKLIQLNTPVFNSEVYFVGGRRLDRDGFLCYGRFTDIDEWYSSSDVFGNEPYQLYSDKVFTYNLLSGEWKELPCRLNITRGLAHVVIAGGVAYIIGGSIIDFRDKIPDKEHWIECYNLNLLDDVDGNNNRKQKEKKKVNWEYLPATSAPPIPVFEDYFPMCTFVYDLGNVIVFVMHEARCYAFNYVSKTWAPFLENINDHVRVHRVQKVVVIDHLLFWHDDNYIRAYDLKNDRLVLALHLIQLNISMDVRHWLRSFLERVGHDTLVLICQNQADWPVYKFDIFKFQIQNMAEASYDNLVLTLIGRGCFLLHDSHLHDVVAA